MIITTSWDDGHPLDLKIAGLLNKYGLDGTFYVPCYNSENRVMDDNQLRDLALMFEIGGHTVNHLYLNNLSQTEAKDEIFNCKLILQDKLGKTIDAFCFPGGIFSNRDVDLLKNAGFLFGRTTALLRNSIDINQPLMNTSIQLYNHNITTLLKHCIKRLHFKPIITYDFFLPYSKNVIELTKVVLNEVLKQDEVFHLWGHSWEIEKYNLWFELEEIFKLLKDQNEITMMNNSNCWKYFIDKKNRI